MLKLGLSYIPSTLGWTKMAPWGQKSERCLALTSRDDYEANWNGQTGAKDRILSEADALTKSLLSTLQKVRNF